MFLIIHKRTGKTKHLYYIPELFSEYILYLYMYIICYLDIILKTSFLIRVLSQTFSDKPCWQISSRLYLYK